jgi:hypothetical protein
MNENESRVFEHEAYEAGKMAGRRYAESVPGAETMPPGHRLWADDFIDSYIEWDDCPFEGSTLREAWKIGVQVGARKALCEITTN